MSHPSYKRVVSTRAAQHTTPSFTPVRTAKTPFFVCFHHRKAHELLYRPVNVGTPQQQKQRDIMKRCLIRPIVCCRSNETTSFPSVRAGRKPVRAPRQLLRTQTVSSRSGTCSKKMAISPQNFSDEAYTNPGLRACRKGGGSVTMRAG